VALSSRIADFLGRAQAMKGSARRGPDGSWPGESGAAEHYPRTEPLTH
jgi:hypothetical protein